MKPMPMLSLVVVANWSAPVPNAIFRMPVVTFESASMPRLKLAAVDEEVRNVAPLNVASVEDALVPDAKFKLPQIFTLLSCEVDDAWSPAAKRIGVEVELTVWPKFVAVVYGNAKVVAEVR